MSVEKVGPLSSSFNKESTSGEITETSGAAITVQAASEHRSIPVIAPFGFACVPPVGEKTLLLSLGEKFFSPGLFMKDKGLKSGEIMIYSQAGASILLNEQGEIVLSSSGGAKLVLDKSGNVLLNNRAVDSI